MFTPILLSIEFGPVPSDESCVQVGQSGYEAQSRSRCHSSCDLAETGTHARRPSNHSGFECGFTEALVRLVKRASGEPQFARGFLEHAPAAGPSVVPARPSQYEAKDV
ncbi:hypothetical protein [Cupriavidus necator]|uniref:hypothetical protein n=1 Tax=Cupriavidus necator TaxID=106590 RepID=UPI0009C2434C|nr:hypothetical protein [Cupriavidus necator]